MFDDANKVYEPLADAIIWLADVGLLPKRLGELFVRLRTYYEAAREAYLMDLASLTWELSPASRSRKARSSCRATSTSDSGRGVAMSSLWFVPPAPLVSEASPPSSCMA